MATVQWEFDRSDRSRKVHVRCGGAVLLERGRPSCKFCGLVDDNAVWINKLLLMNWHLLSFDGWPGWDIVGDGPDRHPPFVKLRLCAGQTLSSTAIDREWDDISEGLFYSRDWTSDGSPFVRNGGVYTSGFWFEKMTDRDRFMQRYAALVQE